MAPKIAARMENVQPFHVMELLARAAALQAGGKSIIHLEIGEPDFPTARPIVQAGVRALHAGLTHYTPATGLTILREAVARFYQDHHGCNIPPERIVITTGASGALQLICGVLINFGDRVLMADPGYPCNPNLVRLFGGEPMLVQVGADTYYQLNSKLIREHWGEGSKGVWLATPSNPTGTLIPESELRAIIEDCRARDAFLIVDEIYQGLVYGHKAITAAALADDIFVVNSFSKYFGMTGWRLGWLVAPEGFVREIEKLAQNIFLAPPTPAQHAALAALEPATLEIHESRREAFRQRRDFILPALRELGFDIPIQPDGAFYIYANSGRFGQDSVAFAARLLNDHGIAITPGIDFGNYKAEKHVRFAYTNSLQNLEQGVKRLRRALD
ncbi:MAG TPA: pyridoxal phosphate-dependent aminotransferase [Gammaproteobacteria bacterium]|nr:pyridoxal phosphate-dependent aminotransferase [Gammaproteobacteria bacterium]